MPNAPVPAGNRSDPGRQAFSSRNCEANIITSARTPVYYPVWVHFLAGVIFLVNCAKIPASINIIGDSLRLLKEAATESLTQAATAGMITMCLISGLIGASLMYVLHCRRARAQDPRNPASANLRKISMWQLLVALALILPDLWLALVGRSPYLSWFFLAAFTTAVALVTLRMGRPKDLLATLPACLLLGFVL